MLVPRHDYWSVGFVLLLGACSAAPPAPADVAVAPPADAPVVDEQPQTQPDVAPPPRIALTCEQAFESGDFDAVELDGEPEQQAELRHFLQTTYALRTLAGALEERTIAACAELGRAVGMPAADLRATPDGGEGAKKACNAVAAQVQATMAAHADATMSIEVGEPTCYEDVRAMRACLVACGATISARQLEASCEGGEIVKRRGAVLCTGELTPTGVDAQCANGCKVATTSKVTCDLPVVNVSLQGAAAPDVIRLKKGLELALPKLMVLQLSSSRRLIELSHAMIGAAEDLPSLARSEKNMKCVSLAMQESMQAPAAIAATVEAIAAVTAATSGP